MTVEILRDITKQTNPGDEPLISALKAVVPNLSYAYVFDWIPEQGLMIYSVVLPSRRVAIAELAESGEANITLYSLAEYKRLNPRLSAEKRRRLALAEGLI